MAAPGALDSGLRSWEHPFCNVFKHVKIDEWKRSDKVGIVDKVLVRGPWRYAIGCAFVLQPRLTLRIVCRVCMRGVLVQDQAIGKHAYTVKGSISASNYIQVPSGSRSAGDTRAGLGLSGRFVYIQVCVRAPVALLPSPVSRASRMPTHRMRAVCLLVLRQLCVPARKHCTLRLDVRTTSRKVIQLSFSGLYRDFKFAGSVARIPLRLPASRWTVVCFDLPLILEAVTRGEYTAEDFDVLKSVMLCATMTVRNVYTSHILYNPEVLRATACYRVLWLTTPRDVVCFLCAVSPQGHAPACA